MSRVELTEGPDVGMCWHHGSPLAETRKMAAGAGLLPLSSREVFVITGDYAGWLHSLTTQDFTSAKAPAHGQALALDANGHIQHGFSFIRDPEQIWCWGEPGSRADIVAWLERMKFWTEVEINARNDLTVVWRGSGQQVSPEALATGPSVIGTGWCDIIPGQAVDEEVSAPAGQWGHQALRIEAGVPRIGIDTDDKTIPNELGLFATALDKGCYPGQETVARIQVLGRPPRRLVRLLFDGAAPETGSPIIFGDREIGTLTSVAQHYELGPIGLGLIKRQTPIDAVLKVGGTEAGQEALVDPEIGEHFRPRLDRP